MAEFKCKSCGGKLQIRPDNKTGECIYCGLQQTLYDPSIEAKNVSMELAERYRKDGNYDLAAGQYAQALSYDRTDPEPYWGLVMCKYGILYVEDPASGKMVPTVNRASYDPILTNRDYCAALLYATDSQKEVYQKDAEYLAQVQQKILNISKQQESYDIFLSYKEKDAVGQRTEDFVMGYEVYQQLTNAGYRVFFSYVSLKNVAGQDFEAHIFSALHSARIMFVLGTRKEFIESPWVKNEWSRFLSLIDKGEEKTLVPLYKGGNPYDILPNDFNDRKLQGIDLGNMTAMQEVLRTVENVIGKKKGEPTTPPPSNQNADTLYQSAQVYMGLSEVGRARNVYEEMIKLYPSDSRGWWGLATTDEGALGSPRAQQHVANAIKLADATTAEKYKNIYANDVSGLVSKAYDDYLARYLKEVTDQEQKMRQLREKDPRTVVAPSAVQPDHEGKKVNENAGMTRIIIGIILTLTVEGAIIGIPLIIWGIVARNNAKKEQEKQEVKLVELGNKELEEIIYKETLILKEKEYKVAFTRGHEKEFESCELAKWLRQVGVQTYVDSNDKEAYETIVKDSFTAQTSSETEVLDNLNEQISDREKSEIIQLYFRIQKLQKSFDSISINDPSYSEQQRHFKGLLEQMEELDPTGDKRKEYLNLVEEKKKIIESMNADGN